MLDVVTLHLCTDHLILDSFKTMKNYMYTGDRVKVDCVRLIGDC